MNLNKSVLIKDIEIIYNNGQKFNVCLTDESYANVFGCLLDDDTVSVSHSMGRVVLDGIVEQMKMRDECNECAD